MHLNFKERQELKKKWATQYEPLEIIINEWDPVHLIRQGAPTDEYDCLTLQVLAKLHEGKSFDDLKMFIMVELQEHFGYGVKFNNVELRDKFIQRVDAYVEKIVLRYDELQKPTKVE